MNALIKMLYKYLPNSIINALGKSRVLKNTRNKFLRPNSKELIVKEEVVWNGKKFSFFAPIRIAVKAKKRGIENKLLRNSIQLINQLDTPNPVVLDIGSNYGFISLALQTNLNSGATIYAFEPHP
jgi:hypothetical protein